MQRRSLSLALLLLSTGLVLGCAGAASPAPEPPPAEAAAPTEAAASTEAEPVVQDLPLVSASRRLPPPQVELLVLGLPDAATLPEPSRPPELLAETLAPAPSADAGLGLAEPLPPPLPEAAKTETPPASAPIASAVVAPPAVKAGASPPAAPATVAPAPASGAKKQSTSQGPAPLAAPALPAAPPSIIPYLEPTSSKAEPRQLSVTLGEKFEIPFTGTGWTYLGEQEQKEGIRYDSRHFESAGVVFSLIPTVLGDFSLRFQRQDLLKGQAVDEFVKVRVLPAAASKDAASTQASASPAATGSAQSLTKDSTQSNTPDSVQANPKDGATPEATNSAAPGTTGSATAPSSSSGASSAPAASPEAGNPAVSTSAKMPDSPEGLLAAAREAVTAGKAADALAALDRFLALYPAGMDEVYLLYGQTYELNGPYRDIRRAYDAYKRLRDNYPQSQFWDKAQERVAYIERHYFEIR